MGVSVCVCVSVCLQMTHMLQRSSCLCRFVYVFVFRGWGYSVTTLWTRRTVGSRALVHLEFHCINSQWSPECLHYSNLKVKCIIFGLLDLFGFFYERYLDFTQTPMCTDVFTPMPSSREGRWCEQFFPGFDVTMNPFVVVFPAAWRCTLQLTIIGKLFFVCWFDWLIDFFFFSGKENKLVTINVSANSLLQVKQWDFCNVFGWCGTVKDT